VARSRVLVCGAARHGRAVLDAALRRVDLEVVGLRDDDPALAGRVLRRGGSGDVVALQRSLFHDCRVVVAVGDPGG